MFIYYIESFRFFFQCQLCSRYNAITNSYHDDMAGEGVICLAVDILPTEFPKEVCFNVINETAREDCHIFIFIFWINYL